MLRRQPAASTPRPTRSRSSSSSTTTAGTWTAASRQDIHVPLYNNWIGPGAARVVHYRFTVPNDAKDSITLSAGVHYRKFSRDYTTFSLGAASPSLSP